MTTTTEPLRLAEYAAWTDHDEGYTTELVRGRVVREPRPARPHGRLQVRISRLLAEWVDGHGRGEVTSESGYVLFEEPATVRGPDIAVSLSPSDADVGGWTLGPPDVAVEISSPSDTSSAMQAKVLDYLQAGTSLVWIVDPSARTVTVYRPDGSAALLREGDLLVGEDVLPGFSISLLDLFGS
jgi:Uma2 family endonuclease